MEAPDVHSQAANVDCPPVFNDALCLSVGSSLDAHMQEPKSLNTNSSPTAGCGLVGYTKSTAAYLFDSSGTKNNFAACKAACNADSRCKSFGYGEANCMLFDVPA